MPHEPVDLSVVIPVYNERDNLALLLEELFAVLRGLGKAFEVICIDDGSTDDSLAVLREQKRVFPELRVIRHKLNCGESAAQATGFAHARGDVIITMDGDQQNDPADIAALIEALAGADVVSGIRKKREDDWVKRVSSLVANGFRNWVTGHRVTDAGCTYRALRKSALQEIPVFNGMHRFLPTLLSLKGYTVKEVVVNHRPRLRGESKYGIGNRILRGMVDCIAILWWRRRAVPGDRALPEDETTSP